METKVRDLIAAVWCQDRRLGAVLRGARTRRADGAALICFHTIAVKGIDIFGNDTMTLVPVTAG